MRAELWTKARKVRKVSDKRIRQVESEEKESVSVSILHLSDDGSRNKFDIFDEIDSDSDSVHLLKAD